MMYVVCCMMCGVYYVLHNVVYIVCCMMCGVCCGGMYRELYDVWCIMWMLVGACCIVSVLCSLSFVAEGDERAG